MQLVQKLLESYLKQKILKELKRYDDSLFEKQRWLVLNKLDLVPETERQAVCDEIVKGLKWKGPVYQISAISRSGVDQLCQDIMIDIESDEESKV